jgi:hypothetical protein
LTTHVRRRSSRDAASVTDAVEREPLGRKGRALRPGPTHSARRAPGRSELARALHRGTTPRTVRREPRPQDSRTRLPQARAYRGTAKLR